MKMSHWMVFVAFLSFNYMPFGESTICNRKLTTKEKCDASSRLTNTNDEQDVEWIKECVVYYYMLQPFPEPNPKPLEKTEFKKPVFASELQNFKFGGYFERAAKRIEEFFKRNRSWKNTKNKYNNGVGNDDLLAITDARYLYVTYVLFIQSDKTLIPCVKDSLGKFKLPAGVCFPQPYGSANPTSDYDVGLIGHTSGTLTGKFNKYFKEIFQSTSEEVFDTNVYAFTLEYAMPELFTGMTGFFEKVVPYLGVYPWYQMQELASAYFKMYKYNNDFYEQLKEYALNNLGPTGKMQNVPNRRLFFEKAIGRLQSWNDKMGVKNIDQLRTQHNTIYEEKVKKSMTGFDSQYYPNIANYMSEMSIALLYAAEAYHTRGAMRHVVGDLQMKSEIVRKGNMIMDFWVSMIENWADANKEYNHCKEVKADACLLKMSKYLYRTFNAIKKMYNILSLYPINNAIKAAKLKLKNPVQNGFDPEKITYMWVKDFKGKADKIPEFEKNVRPFLKSIGCDLAQKDNTVLHFECMNAIQKIVMSYNELLVSATAKYSDYLKNMFTLITNVKHRPQRPY